MSSSLLNIAATGLRVADINLQVTGNNVANVNTPGYSRQEAIQVENLSQFVGGNYLGQGASVATIRRIYDDFLAAQIQSGQAATAAAKQLDGLVSGLDKYLSDSSSGLGSALTNFFNAADNLVSRPSDTSTRQIFLNAASGLQSRFNAIGGRMNTLSGQINTQMQTQIGTVNGITSQIADLNDKIVNMENTTGRPANDLRDQREQLVQTLNQSIKASVVQTGDGQYNIYVGNGQALVQGKQSYQMIAAPSQYDSTQLSVGYKGPAGTVNIADNLLGGGALGALMDFRQNTLIPAQNNLDRLATAIATDVNAQSKLGMDLNGNMGTDLFSVSTPSVAASSNNTGSGVLTATITNANQLQGYDYQVKYSGGAYTVSRYPDGSGAIAVTGWPTTIHGVTINLSGVMADGDSFLLRPSASAAVMMKALSTDYRTVAAASPVVADLGSNNTGQVSVASIGVDSSYASAPLTSPISLSYSSSPSASLSGFPGSVVMTVDGTSTTYSGTAPYVQGATYTFNGIQLSFAGTPSNNDTFTISANTANSTDAHNASAFARLRSAPLLDNDTTSFGSAWGNLVTQVGVQASQANTNLISQNALLDSAVAQQQSLSGVSLDEEAMNLIKFQQAYQASAKVMQTANTLFDSLLAI